MIDAIRQPSPNFGERAADAPLQFVVLHYTNMTSGAAARAHLCDPKSEVSAHYLIEEDGKLYQMVDEDKRAWHAGKSFWRGVTDINSASIGIELANPGHRYGYRAFPEKQIATLENLLRDILQRYSLPAACVLGHSDIAPDRKEDPGELFPWQRLAEKGLGLWPKPEAGDYGPCDDGEVQNFLRSAGYNCPASGHYDPPTRKCLLAFQRHYEPNNLTGTPEPETIARLRALVRMLR